MTNAEIIETAALVLAVDRSPDDADLIARLDAALKHLNDDGDPICLMSAHHPLSGKRFIIHSDNPEHVRRARSIAAELGADVEDYTERGIEHISGSLPHPGAMVVLLTPPTKS